MNYNQRNNSNGKSNTEKDKTKAKSQTRQHSQSGLTASEKVQGELLEHGRGSV